MPPKKRSHSHRSSNASTQGTILLTKDTVILTRKYSKLNKVTGASLVTDYESLITKPESVAQSDWLITNAIEYLNRVEKLYSSCSLFCTSDTCPMFNAGPHYHYLWEDDTSDKRTQLSTPEYLLALKRWVKRKLSNPDIFPPTNGAPLSEEATQVLETIYRRTTRLLAHLYLCHFSHLHAYKMEPIINTLLAQYTILALKNKMITPADVEMLQPVYAAMKIELPA